MNNRRRKRDGGVNIEGMKWMNESNVVYGNMIGREEEKDGEVGMRWCNRERERESVGERCWREEIEKEKGVFGVLHKKGGF